LNPPDAPPRPADLWPSLSGPQQQALVQLLSELIQRRLRLDLGREVADETR
jgi:hypothetical protein